ncbi:MAG: sigma-70 family RNA polymerase sigma factor [Verrucomicrobiae bacterium]|nr:sigma-70 family RNA polymerase sigma factor [Verrucomicrobiae bacterium]
MADTVAGMRFGEADRNDEGKQSMAAGKAAFLSTRWSLVLRAGDLENEDESSQALEHLCRAYWYPLYAFVRRSGKSKEDAQDLTQGLFAKLVSTGSISGVDASRGRFRSYLLQAMQNFMRSEWRKETAEKRGGREVPFSLDAEDAEGRYQHEPAGDDYGPEMLFDRRWARAVLEQVFDRLLDEYRRTGKMERYERLKPCLLDDPATGAYGEIAAALRMTESGVRTQVHRMRARFAALLREEVAGTVNDPADVDGELSYLLRSLS